MTIRRLFVDLETSPNVGYFWRPGWKVALSHSNIVEERRIICGCWKWDDEDEVHSIDWGRKRDDKRIVKRLAPILEQADEVIGHNGDRFDIPWLRGRALFHGIPMSPHITSQDTLKLSRRYFGLNSHRLDYIGGFIGQGHKMNTDFALWKRVMAGDSKSLKYMVDYCKRDVELLEEAWDIMSPYFPAKTHVSGNRGECPNCGSSNMKVSRYRTTASGSKRVQLVCGDCGRYHTAPAKLFPE